MIPEPRPRTRPGIVWIVLAVLLMVGGPAGCGAFVVARAVGIVTGLDAYGRFRLPVEEAQVSFPEPGRGVLWARVDASGGPPRLTEPSLRGSGGATVRLRPTPGTSTLSYNLDGEAVDLVEMWNFEIDQPGSYRLSVGVAEGNAATEIWVGRDGVGGAAPGMVRAFLIAGAIFGIGLLMLIVVLVRRSASRRRVPAVTPPPPPGGWTQGYSSPPSWGAPPPPGWPPPPEPGAPPPAPPSGWGPPPGSTPPTSAP